MSYELTCEIETTQAEKARKVSSESTVLPLMPQDNGGVPTMFWVDNSDCIIESVTGGGSVNTTCMMVFQERSQQVISRSILELDPKMFPQLAKTFKILHE